MTAEDPVRDLLLSHGCPSDVVSGGLDGLVTEWERTVRQVEAGYSLGLDDYLNDLDGRQLIADALTVALPAQRAKAAKRVDAADAAMRKRVRLVDECLWGGRVAAREGWTPERNWWYFAVPLTPGATLRDDLEASEF